MYAQESIDLLQHSGIQFKKHEEEGIEVNDFAELLMTSGIVLSEQVKWLSFHRYLIGYHFTGTKWIIMLYCCHFTGTK